MCSERWILFAEMCDSLQNKYQDNIVPVCNRDDRKAINNYENITNRESWPKT